MSWYTYFGSWIFHGFFELHYTTSDHATQRGMFFDLFLRWLLLGRLRWLCYGMFLWAILHDQLYRRFTT